VATARIGVVEDHALLVAGLRALLADVDGLDVVGAAGTVDELLAQTTDLDLVLLDLRLADASRPGPNAARLRAAGAEVLAYTSGEDPVLVREAARADVIGMIGKSEPAHVLVGAIRAALRGEVVASTDWAAAIDADAELPAAALSPRETQVLRLYASGEKAERVAHQLGISKDTVLDHVRNIRTKYARAQRPAHTKVDLYRRAVEDGVLPGPG
jgi:DNA-binding NarL/FixJ family response regulator